MQLIVNTFSRGVLMKIFVLGLIAAAVTATFANAQQLGRPAYPDNWNGGAPLPPIGYSTTVVGGSYAYSGSGQVVYVQLQTNRVAVQAVQLHPQTELSRQRAHQYRFGTNAPSVIYLSN
jgi:hypothetical protein